MRRIRLHGLVGLSLAAPALGGGISPSSQDFPPFIAHTIAPAGAPAYGLLAVESDAEHPGPELAVLRGDGSLELLRAAPGGWDSMTIADGLGAFSHTLTRPTLAAGDVDTGSPGPELVVSVDTGVYAIARDATGAWSKTFIFDRSGVIGLNWGARIGDLDPLHPGDEVFHIFEGIFDHSAGTIYRHDGGWQAETIFAAEVGMDSAFGEFDAANPGPELVVTTEMGPTYALHPPAKAGEPWAQRVLWDDFDNAGWVVKIADVDPQNPGNELVFGTRYLNRVLVTRGRPDGTHEIEIAYDGEPSPLPSGMYDIAIGHPLPTGFGAPAAQVVGVDQQGDVTLVARAEPGWRAEIIWQAPADALYAVAAGQWLADCPQTQLIVGGESGALTLLAAVTPGDLDEDGLVDIGDLAALLANFGLETGASYEQGDVDRDGDVDIADLGRLLPVFGASCKP